MEEHYRSGACRGTTPFFSRRTSTILSGHENDLTGKAYRTVFQHDRDKVLYSHSFRRLRLKTQIFPEHTSDHLRTRLDHTLEVAQIGRHLARQLNLNEDLVDAIALAHDIGHTPFAHSGERALHRYLIRHDCHGLKHNWQGLRVVDLLERMYPDQDGINLTNAVRIGILKHTSRNYSKFPDEVCDSDMGDIVSSQFDIESPRMDVFEIQIIQIADEIAGVIHDLEDSLISKSISLSELIDDGLGSELIIDCIDSLKEKNIALFVKGTNHNDRLSFLLSRLRSELIYKLTLDIIVTSKPLLETWEEKTIKCDITEFNKFVNEENDFPPLIKLDQHSSSFIELKKIITNRVILSERINRMDGKADYVIRKILEVYETSPKQVPDCTLEQYKKAANLEATNNIRDWSDQELSALCKDHKFIRSIVDYVAGMTDRFALREYDILYSAYPRTAL